jgi:hypothetical protein
MKLTLDLHALQVESFDTLPVRGLRRGTVHAAENCPTHDCTLQYDTCGCTKDYETCYASCDPCATCDTSCAGGPFCDCLPSGCISCETSCAGGPQCDCAPTPTCPTS